MDYAARIERLQAAMGAQELDALLVFSPENRFYLTGFSGTNGQVWVTPDETVFLTDGRYEAQAAVEVAADRTRIYKRFADELGPLAKGLDAGARVGFEGSGLSVSQWERLRGALSLDPEAWRDASSLLQALRTRKDAGEVACIRRAIERAEGALEAEQSRIAVGALERDVALALEWHIRSAGARSVPFEFIVASGGRSALPHGVASDKPLAHGEPVTLDFGAEYAGYFSDMTFAGSVAQADAWTEEVVGILQEAQQAALERCHPGVPCCEADAAARRVIEEAGYGEAFVHSLGHGVGLAVHEYPRLSAQSDEVLAEGMVVTVEPGIYVADRGGARIEDMVLIGQAGPEVLTNLPKDARLWGANGGDG